jgi:hypothetical protein
MTMPDLAARRPGQAGGKPQKAYTKAKNIRKKMWNGESHHTLARCRQALGALGVRMACAEKFRPPALGNKVRPARAVCVLAEMRNA